MNLQNNHMVKDDTEDEEIRWAFQFPDQGEG